METSIDMITKVSDQIPGTLHRKMRCKRGEIVIHMEDEI